MSGDAVQDLQVISITNSAVTVGDAMIYPGEGNTGVIRLEAVQMFV